MRFFFFIFFLLPALFFADPPKKILHLSYHEGCIKEFEKIATLFSYQVDSWHIPSLPPYFFDETSKGCVLYNMTHDRAERVWNKHKDTFYEYDLILVSDTAPISRIFLQNGFTKPLLIWICNRFDYCDMATLDGPFPDEEYFDLFEEAQRKPNVTTVAYTPFEHYYTKTRGIDTGNLLITPFSPISESPLRESAIPRSIKKRVTFFLPPYHNETIYMNLEAHLKEMGIKAYCGRYNGAADLADFKGVIHIPYSWSNLALFENIAHGIIYFIPSRTFFQQLATTGDFFHPNLGTLINENLYDLSEWYDPSRKELFVYFDSWDDLLVIIKTTDYKAQKQKILNYAADYRQEMLNRWSDLFEKIFTVGSAK